MEFKIIQKSIHHCQNCNTTYQNQEICYTALFESHEDEKEKVVIKASFCQNCWPQVQEQKNFLCFWKRKFQKTPPPKKEFDRQMAIHLLESFRLSQDETKKKIAYLLALVLIRKKIYKWKEIVFEKGEEYLLLSPVKSKKEIKIKVPSLKQEEIECIKEKLLDMLMKKTDFNEKEKTNLSFSQEESLDGKKMD